MSTGKEDQGAFDRAWQRVDAAEKAASTERALDQAEHKVTILEARDALRNDAASWLNTELAALGPLLAVMLIFFALRTEKAAKIAARDEIAAERAQILRLVADAEAANRAAAEAREASQRQLNADAALFAGKVNDTLAGAEEILQRLERVDAEARSRHEALIAFVAQRIASHGPVSDSEMNAIRHALAEAKERPPEMRSAQDYHVLIADASQGKKWWLVGNLAREFGERIPDNADAQSASLFYQAVSYGARKFDRPAIDTYDRLIAEFNANADPGVVRRVARGRFNRARRLSDAESQAAFRDLIHQYTRDPDPELRLLAVDSKMNLAIRLARSQQLLEAVALYDEIIAEFERGTADREAELANDAWYNRACAHARAGEPEAAVQSLLQWGRRIGYMSHDDLRLDDAFDAIRDHPDFVALMKNQRPENGA